MKSLRIWVMWVFAVIIIGVFAATDPDGWQATAVRVQWLLWVVVAAGPVYLLRRALMDKARSGDAYRKAMETSFGAGLVYLGLCFVTGALFLAVAGRAMAEEIPPLAKAHVPQLRWEVASFWADAPIPEAFAGQVEQETCTSLKSKRCWSPEAELKTSREYGFGLGQLTVTKAFDNFASARGLDKSLRDWRWTDRYDPAKQLRTMVLMDRAEYRKLRVPLTGERFAMALSAYNGGGGGLAADRRVCAAAPGCDANAWFGNVELHSLKSKVRAAGYGKSFFEINREYVRNIMLVRSAKYREVMRSV